MRLCNHCTCTLGSLAQLLDTFTDLTLVLRDSKLDRIRETLTEGIHLDFVDQVLHILPVANKENINSVFSQMAIGSNDCVKMLRKLVEGTVVSENFEAWLEKKLADAPKGDGIMDSLFETLFQNGEMSADGISAKASQFDINNVPDDMPQEVRDAIAKIHESAGGAEGIVRVMRIRVPVNPADISDAEILKPTTSSSQAEVEVIH